jgi:hypothetical protein
MPDHPHRVTDIPIGLDPAQRAREYRQRHRDDGWTRNETQRLRELERKAKRAEKLASQPDQTSPMETVDALPDPTADFLGRSLVLRTPGGFRSSVNTAIQLADDTVVWQQMQQEDAAFTVAWVRNFGTAGSGGANTWRPVSVDYTNTGDVWVCDNGNHQFKRFTAAGGTVFQCGGAGAGAGLFGGASATNYPTGTNSQPSKMCVRQSDQSVTGADYINKRVTVYSGAGAYVGQIDEASVPVVFQSIYGIRWDAVGYRWLLTDYAFDELMFFDVAWTFTGSITPGGGSSAGLLDYPIDAASDSIGNIYILEFNNHRVSKFNAAGSFLQLWGGNGSTDGKFNQPAGIFIDGNDRVYVADAGNDRVQIFDSSGNFLLKFGTSGTGNGQLDGPWSVCVTPAGVVFVADYNNSRISVWQASN